MWNSQDIKKRAKDTLNEYFKIAIVGIIIYSIFNAINVLISTGIIRYIVDNMMDFGQDVNMRNAFMELIKPVMENIIGIFVLAIPLVGYTSLLMALIRKEEDAKAEMVYSQFKSGRMGNIIATKALAGIQVLLWSILIIPGIIKMIEFSFVDHILVDNPELSSREVLAKSKKMTDGQKGKIFLFELSFVGWLFLLTFVLSIIIASNPNMNDFIISIIGLFLALPLNLYIGLSYARLYDVNKEYINRDREEEEKRRQERIDALYDYSDNNRENDLEDYK